MESETDAREVRAARNQSLFRAVNERLKEMNDAFAQFADTYAITCECADVNCIETVEITPDQYSQVRAQPRQFVVRASHVLPEAERVVREDDGYVVVEKFGVAGAIAEAIVVR